MNQQSELPAATSIWDDQRERLNRLSHLRESTDNKSRNFQETTNHNNVPNYATLQNQINLNSHQQQQQQQRLQNQWPATITLGKQANSHIDYIDSSNQQQQQQQTASTNNNNNNSNNPYWLLHRRSAAASPNESIFDSSMTIAASQRASLGNQQSGFSTPEQRQLSSQNSNQQLLKATNLTSPSNTTNNKRQMLLRHRQSPLNGDSSEDNDDDDDDNSQSDFPLEPYSRKGCVGQCCFAICRWLMYLIITLLILALFSLAIYFYPIEGPQFEAKKLPGGPLPRPKFVGPWQVNGSLNNGLTLDQAETIFENQFHGPESMAWTQDKSAFYTGVEGGFILRVEPYAERWFVVARLNGRSPPIKDLSHQVQWDIPLPASFQPESPLPKIPKNNLIVVGQSDSSVVPFCTKDIELYGKRAEFEPSLVRLSRCSRPLGLRLAPDDSHLYVSDTLSGLYKINLTTTSNLQPEITRIIKFDPDQNKASKLENSEELEKNILFGDDITIDWQEEIIYFTDCSQRWNVRHLIWLMGENDDSGRVLQFKMREKVLKPLTTITPVRYQRKPEAPIEFDWRNLSFPNGIELSSNGDYFLLADLNNRRILKHYLRGPLIGQSEFLLRVPGFPDNIRRGLPIDGNKQTYWAACACATSDWEKFEIVEFLNEQPWLKKLLLQMQNFFGWSVQSLGELLGSSRWQDAGIALRDIWFLSDPYCTHSLIFQFDENGQVLQSIHAPNYSSKFKMLSEVSQIAYNKQLDKNHLNLFGHDEKQDDLTTNHQNEPESLLYLGSVYYSFLGRLKMAKAPVQFIERTTTTTTNNPIEPSTI